MKWTTGALESIAILDRRSIHPSEAEAATPYLGLEHLDGNGRINCIETVSSAGLKSNKFQFSDRHVLFGKLRPYLRKIAKPEFSGICSTDIIPILPKDCVSRDYLFYFLRTPESVDLATSRCSGANLPRLSPKQLASFQVPLPPLAEQKRIAGILDAADALRAKRREALAQLDTLLQSTFLDMFGDPVTNPMGWTVTCLGDVTKMGTGSTPPRNQEGYFGGSIPWVKSTEINWGTFFTTSECLSSDGVKAARLKLYPTGSILLALYGQGKTRGKCAVLGIDAAINQACCALLPRDPHSTLYLFQFLKFSYHRLRGESRGGNQENLNMRIVRSFPVPMPPLDIQQRYATIAESVEQQRTCQIAHLAELDTLFASLQSRAFRGDL